MRKFYFQIPNWMKLSLKPDLIIPADGEEEDYLHRWWVLPRNPIFNIYVHKVMYSDLDPHIHDHPWTSVGIILKGEYLEEYCRNPHLVPPESLYLMYVGYRTLKRFRPVWRSPNFAHRLLLKEGTVGPVWTLFMTGPHRNDWGFYMKDGEWISHHNYKR